MEHINRDRRAIVGSAALGLLVGVTSRAAALSTGVSSPGTAGSGRTSFASLKQINAGVLNVGYAEDGPADGPPVLLLHGWPCDIYSYVDVAPILAAAGYRVIVTFARGYGSTRFLSADAPRNGQQAALASDIIDLMDALKIEKAVIAGYDWGARSANSAVGRGKSVTGVTARRGTGS